jgi:hypothetical protein
MNFSLQIQPCVDKAIGHWHKTSGFSSSILSICSLSPQFFSQQTKACYANAWPPPLLAMANTLSLSLCSSLQLQLATPTRRYASGRLRTMATATPTTKLAPAVIVGGGRVGRALQEMGNGQDLLVKRGESVPLDFEGPILVCTRNDDLDAVLEATPPSRWNGTFTSSLAISFRCYAVEFCDSSLSVNVEIEWLWLHFDLYDCLHKMGLCI